MILDNNTTKPYANALLQNYIINIMFMVLNFGFIRHNYEKYLISSEYEIIEKDNVSCDENKEIIDKIFKNLIKDVVKKIEENKVKNATYDVKENNDKNDAKNNEKHNFFKMINFIF